MKLLKFTTWGILLIVTVSCNSKNNDSTNSVEQSPSNEISASGTCEKLLDAFNQEFKNINSCTDSAQCGQVLSMTSCGCSRNKVARNDADSTKFYDIISKAKAKKCNLPLTSTCDCPATNGFACVENKCSWNYNKD